MPSLKQKLMISLMSAGLFVLVAHPATFKFTNGIIGGITQNGCPTMLGLVVHAAVFFLLTKLSMRESYQSEELKRKRSLIAAALFALLNSPMAFKLVRGLLGDGIASAAGCPTLMGVVAHAAVYAAVLVLLMG